MAGGLLPSWAATADELTTPQPTWAGNRVNAATCRRSPPRPHRYLPPEFPLSIPAVLVFLVVVLLALVVLPGYIWWRLVRSTTQPGPIRRRLTVLTVVLAALPLAADALNRVLPEEVATPLEWVAYSWLGSPSTSSSPCSPSNRCG